MAFNFGTSAIVSFGDELLGHTLILPPEMTSYDQILDSLSKMTQITIEAKLTQMRIDQEKAAAEKPEEVPAGCDSELCEAVEAEVASVE